MADITNQRLIIVKGFLFLILGLLSSIILICLTLSWQVAMLLAISIWSFCRFYYFTFYVIEHYVDSGFRFSGLMDFIKRLLRGDLKCVSGRSSQVSST